MSGEGEGEDLSLEYSPSWVVAAVCTVIVAISLAVERLLHFTGAYLKKTNRKPLFEALQKVEEELMLLGFISLLLTVFQARINKMCVPPGTMHHMLPCRLFKEEGFLKSELTPVSEGTEFNNEKSHPELIEGNNYCAPKHKVPLLSLESLHHLHMFIFTLALVHVTFTLLTLIIGGAKMRQWKNWEDEIARSNYPSAMEQGVTYVHQNDFIRSRFVGLGKCSAIWGWLHSFSKQFYGSVTKSDYRALRTGFIMTHCRGNPKFNFHKYMIRALEYDFKKVVGISWYLWVFVVIFLLLNVNGWHTYFWIAFVTFALLLALGTKLQHVIIQLAHEVAEKHAAIEGELVVQPSDDHFWFKRPRIVLYFIHFILFQNAFEIAFFFWMWVQYGFGSCIMGEVKYIIARFIIGVIIQVLCSYSTLPLYAIVTQMGSRFKKSIFDEHIRAGLIDWAQKAKRKERKAATPAPNEAAAATATAADDGSSVGVQMGEIYEEPSTSGLHRDDDHKT